MRPPSSALGLGRGPEGRRHAERRGGASDGEHDALLVKLEAEAAVAAVEEPRRLVGRAVGQHAIAARPQPARRLTEHAGHGDRLGRILRKAHVALRPLAVPARAISRRGAGSQEGERVARVHRPRRVRLRARGAAQAHLVRGAVDPRDRAARPRRDRRDVHAFHRGAGTSSGRPDHGPISTRAAGAAAHTSLHLFV